MEPESLWKEYRAAVERAIRQTSASRHVSDDAAEDLAQELRLYVMKNDFHVLRAYQGRSAVGTYLFRVMARRAAKWLRHGTRRRAIEIPCGDTYLEFAEKPAHWLARQRPPAETGANHRAALRALSSLTGIERRLIQLRFAQGLSWRVVAERTDLSCKAAENRLYRALGKLRRAVEYPEAAEGGKEGRKEGKATRESHEWRGNAAITLRSLCQATACGLPKLPTGALASPSNMATRIGSNVTRIGTPSSSRW